MNEYNGSFLRDKYPCSNCAFPRFMDMNKQISTFDQHFFTDMKKLSEKSSNQVLESIEP